PPRIHILPLKTTPAAPKRGLQPAAFVSCFQETPSVEDQTSLLAEACLSRPPCQPPMIHILSLKTSVVDKSLCLNSAFFASSFQLLPSAELQTSRGGSSKD